MLNWYSHQVLLNYAEHAHLGWYSDQSSALAHEYAWLPISLSEMAQASIHLPIVIMRYQQCCLIAVLLVDSSLPNANVRNIASLKHLFLPRCVQAYPFSLMPSDDSKSGLQLAIDHQCLVPLKEKGALPLFSENRQFSPAVTDRFHLLHRLKIDSEIVNSACELLSRKGLLVLIADSEKMSVTTKGSVVPLYRVDIDAIGRLSREDFADLQMHHAMELGVYQYSSLFHTAKSHQYAN